MKYALPKVPKAHDDVLKLLVFSSQQKPTTLKPNAFISQQYNTEKSSNS